MKILLHLLKKQKDILNEIVFQLLCLHIDAHDNIGIQINEQISTNDLLIYSW